MDFYYDVVDWVCGYPYEHATLDEVASFLEKKGFSNRKTIRTRPANPYRTFSLHVITRQSWIRIGM
jgi:hypothetical protein